jgi:hypothetical protein
MSSLTRPHSLSLPRPDKTSFPKTVLFALAGSRCRFGPHDEPDEIRSLTKQHILPVALTKEPAPAPDHLWLTRLPRSVAALMKQFRFKPEELGARYTGLFNDPRNMVLMCGARQAQDGPDKRKEKPRHCQHLLDDTGDLCVGAICDIARRAGHAARCGGPYPGADQDDDTLFRRLDHHFARRTPAPSPLVSDLPSLVKLSECDADQLYDLGTIWHIFSYYHEAAVVGTPFAAPQEVESSQNEGLKLATHVLAFAYNTTRVLNQQEMPKEQRENSTAILQLRMLKHVLRGHVGRKVVGAIFGPSSVEDRRKLARECIDYAKQYAVMSLALSTALATLDISGALKDDISDSRSRTEYWDNVVSQVVTALRIPIDKNLALLKEARTILRQVVTSNTESLQKLARKFTSSGGATLQNWTEARSMLDNLIGDSVGAARELDQKASLIAFE